MNSLTKPEAKLTEIQCAAVTIESRIASLTAAVYFLMALVMVVGLTLGASMFQDEIATLDTAARKLTGWLLYLPVVAFVVGAYISAWRTGCEVGCFGEPVFTFGISPSRSWISPNCGYSAKPFRARICLPP